jgi:hypothetical protein
VLDRLVDRVRQLLGFVLLFAGFAAEASAQHEHHVPAPTSAGWSWSGAAQVFLTANLQQREFTDFHQLESQNWFMGAGSRRAGGGAVSMAGMLSLEPFTLRELGSAQVFQTGETLGGAPLIDYQHPHDLVMHASVSYARDLSADSQLRFTAALVGEPALGPTVFMHRASALPNPTVPLSHHQLDSTHITPGVLTAGWYAPVWTVETSAFHGREPDENRLDVDLGALDSWSARVLARSGGVVAQFSGARLHEPDAIEPGDMTRLTASVEYVGTPRGRLTTMTLAWGLNDERFGREAGWLAEATRELWRRGTLYLRGELADKHILEAGGAHPPGFEHPHTLSRVGAWTTGYEHRLFEGSSGRWSIGGDLTAHHTPDNLYPYYGHPLSVHLFARWSHGVSASRATRRGMP